MLHSQRYAVVTLLIYVRVCLLYICINAAGSPLCSNGVLGRYSYHGICCPARCRQCDDSSGCTDPRCCSKVIANSGRYCNRVGPPCIVACGPGTGDNPLSTTGRCKPCPVGTYSIGSQDEERFPRPPCTPCKSGTSTAYAGANTASHCQSTYLIHHLPSQSPWSWCLVVPRNASVNTPVYFEGCGVVNKGQHFIIHNSTSTSAAATEEAPATAAFGSYLIINGFCVVPACSTCTNRSSLILSKCDFKSTLPGLRSVMKQGPASSPQARWHYQRSSGELMWLGAAPSNVTLCLTRDKVPVGLDWVWLPLLTTDGCAAAGGTPTTWRLISAVPPNPLAQVPTALQLPMKLNYAEWGPSASCRWFNEGWRGDIAINCTAGKPSSTTCHTAAGAPNLGSNVGRAESGCCWRACNVAKTTANGSCEERSGPPGHTMTSAAGGADVASLPWSSWLHITIPEADSGTSNNSNNSAPSAASMTTIICNPGPFYLRSLPGFYDDFPNLCPTFAWFYIQTAPWCLRPVFDMSPRGWSGGTRGSFRIADSSTGSSSSSSSSSSTDTRSSNTAEISTASSSSSGSGDTGPVLNGVSTDVAAVEFMKARVAYTIDVSDLSVTVNRLFDAVWGGTAENMMDPALQFVDRVLTRADVGRLVGRSIKFSPSP